MGFAVGNERIIAALARVKSYLDYGAFTPIQVAATAALNGPDDCIREMRETYRKRRDILVESFGRAGWDVPPPNASMFAWAPLPEAFREVGSMQFATLMVEKSGVVVSPGVGFGEHAGLPWDLVLSAELFAHYKPDREVYLGAARLLGLQPEQVMMVAAHNNDLKAAQDLGLKTGFVPRPTEYGPLQHQDFKADGDWDIVAADFNDLAARLGC